MFFVFSVFAVLAVFFAFSRTKKATVSVPSKTSLSHSKWVDKTIKDLQDQKSEMIASLSALIDPDGSGGFIAKPGVTKEQLYAANEKISELNAIYDSISKKWFGVAEEKAKLGKSLRNIAEDLKKDPKNLNSPSPYVQALLKN